MIPLLLYAISVMWTPGPVNTVMLNTGIRQGAKKTLPFLGGVFLAMALLVIIYGFFGKILADYISMIIFYVSLIGSGYMFYLAYKLITSRVSLNSDAQFDLKFQQGFLMQFFNPKGTLCALPIATIYLPALNPNWLSIIGIGFLVSAIGGIGVFTIYALTGSLLKQLIKKPIIFQIINYIMAALLIYLAITLIIDHVLLHA